MEECIEIALQNAQIIRSGNSFLSGGNPILSSPNNAPSVYDAERIRKRSEMIGYAIEARKQRFPDETPFEYAPHKENSETFVWTAETKSSLKDYNLLDLSI